MSITTQGRPGYRPRAAAVLLALLSCACTLFKGESEVLVMSYNVMALFDSKDQGREYPEYSVASGAWDDALYRRRLRLLADVILSAGRQGPDILALQEIESLEVLNDLNAVLGQRAYPYGVAAQSESATTVGILSRFPILEARSHQCLDQNLPCERRPILEAKIGIGESYLCVYCNHWKSKLGGEEETEAVRLGQGHLLARLALERLQEEPNALILALGDLNEGPPAGEGSDAPRALGLLGDGSESPLLLYGAKDGPEGLNPGQMAFYSPWLAELGDRYSYYYRGQGERIDHVLANDKLLAGPRLSYLSSRVHSPDFILDGQGRPLAWDGKRAQGYSDHLPLLLSLNLIGGRP